MEGMIGYWMIPDGEVHPEWKIPIQSQMMRHRNVMAQLLHFTFYARFTDENQLPSHVKCCQLLEQWRRNLTKDIYKDDIFWKKEFFPT